MIGTNANDILARTLEHGSYEPRGVQPTTSPSMDIQISSKLRAAAVRGARARRLLARAPDGGLKQSGGFSLSPEVLATVREDFDATAVPETDVADEIAGTYPPHRHGARPPTAPSACAPPAACWRRTRARPSSRSPPRTPAKFPDAVSQATGAGRPRAAAASRRPDDPARDGGAAFQRSGAIERYIHRARPHHAGRLRRHETSISPPSAPPPASPSPGSPRFTVASETIPGVATANARRLGRGRLAPRAGERARAQPPDRAHGVQGHRDALGPHGSPRRSRMSAARSTPPPAPSPPATPPASSAEDTRVALDVLGDILTNSVFDAGELAREKA